MDLYGYTDILKQGSNNGVEACSSGIADRAHGCFVWSLRRKCHDNFSRRIMRRCCPACWTRYQTVSKKDKDGLETP